MSGSVIWNEWAMETSRMVPLILGGLWRAGISGALLAALVWAVCRLLPKLPAAARFWLWWLVCAKLLLGLAFSNTSALPFASPLVLRLPAQHPAAAPAFFVARLAVQPTRFLSNAKAGHSGAPKAGGLPSVAPSVPSAGAEGRERGMGASARPPAARMLGAGVAASPEVRRAVFNQRSGVAALLAFFWAVGFALCLIRRVQEARMVRRLVAEAGPVPESDLQEAVSVARLLGLRRLPRIVASRRTKSPFIAGFWRPVVVLPFGGAAPLSRSETRMALAHEFAHLRRGDLWLGLVPALTEAMFFFFPPARWAARECAMCREEACDQAAISSLGSSALPGYGQLLLKVTLAVQQNRGMLPEMSMAVPVSPAFVLMRRRLSALKFAAHPASPQLRRAAALMIALCIPVLLPWRLRALPKTVPSPGSASVGDAEEALPQYTVIDLGTLGGKVSEAFGVGENGTVVGTANVFPLGNRGHAFSWRRSAEDPGTSTFGGQMMDLCAGSIFRHSVAYAVNARGQAAAVAFNNPSKPSAFVWSPGRSPRRYLGAIPGFRYSRATGINDEGLVVGASLRAETDARGAVPMRAFAWQNGRMRDLGTLGGPFSTATGVNDTGLIVGKSDVAAAGGTQDATHAALWDSATLEIRDMGTLPGGLNSAASAVNDHGDAVGFSDTMEAARHAVLFHGDTLEDLGTLPASASGTVPSSAAFDINDSGWIVGTAAETPAVPASPLRAGAPASRAIAWIPVMPGGGQRRLVDLNRCLPGGTPWTLETARSVNNQGEIVGAGRIGGKRHAFLLVPLAPRPGNR